MKKDRAEIHHRLQTAASSYGKNSGCMIQMVCQRFQRSDMNGHFSHRQITFRFISLDP